MQFSVNFLSNFQWKVRNGAVCTKCTVVQKHICHAFICFIFFTWYVSKAFYDATEFCCVLNFLKFNFEVHFISFVVR